MCHCQGQSSCSTGCSGSQVKSCSCPCHQQSGGCGHGQQQSCCDYAAKFLDLADQAWMEVLKEKIKEHIRSHAKNLDELACVVSEANHERWHKKMENKQSAVSYEEKLRSIFHTSCSSQCQKK